MTIQNISDDDKATLNSAWETFGTDLLIDICIEEMAGLTQALLHMRWGKSDWSYSILEEMADVKICLQQIELQLSKLYGPYATISLYGEIEIIRRMKLNRLKDRIDKYKQDN